MPRNLFAGNLVLDPLQPDSTNEVSRPISKCIRTLTCKYHLSSQVYACNNSVHTTCECYVRSFRVTIYLQPTIQPIWTIINNPWTNNEGSCRTQVTMIGHLSKDRISDLDTKEDSSWCHMRWGIQHCKCETTWDHNQCHLCSSHTIISFAKTTYLPKRDSLTFGHIQSQQHTNDVKWGSSLLHFWNETFAFSNLHWRPLQDSHSRFH